MKKYIDEISSDIRKLEILKVQIEKEINFFNKKRCIAEIEYISKQITDLKHIRSTKLYTLEIF